MAESIPKTPKVRGEPTLMILLTYATVSNIERVPTLRCRKTELTRLGQTRCCLITKHFDNNVLVFARMA